MDQDATWYEGRPQPRPHCVRWGPAAPKNGHSPHFSAHAYCGQTARWIKIPLGKKVGVLPVHFVLDWDPAPSPAKRGTAPQFLADIWCGQMAGWIKMPLGAELGLSSGHIVLVGDAASPHKMGTALQFLAHVCCGQTVAHLSCC